jgi:flagellar basal-body rod protein FlgG
MNGAFYIGAIGLDARQHALEVVANNIANINTTAFKRSAVQFTELVGAPRDVDGAAMTATGAGDLSGAALASTTRIFEQGALQSTGRELDVAIDGLGFVELAGSAGRSLLWRGGALQVNGDGLLASSDGIPLKAMISVPREAGKLTIGRDGVVSMLTDNGSSSQEIGQIDLVLARAPESLTETGSGYYEAADPADLSTARPGDEGAGFLIQGSIEGSNVQLADEMTNLLLMQRAFAANAQVVQAGDQLMSIINSLRRT